MLGQIGSRTIRSPLAQGGIGVAPKFAELAGAMQQENLSSPVPRVIGLATAYLNDPATTWSIQQAAAVQLKSMGMLYAIEGPNELNNHETGGGSHGPDDLIDRSGPADYPGNYLAWARALKQMRFTKTVSPAAPIVVAPSIASGLAADYRALPDVTAFTDVANLHFYAGAGRQPSFSLGSNRIVGNFGNLIAWARSAERPAGPVWITEAGATTSGQYAQDGQSQAKYIANQLFDTFAAGGTETVFYQLIDGSGRAGDVEGNFGLFHHDGTPKPAAVLLANLKHLLSLNLYDDPRNLADDRSFVPGYDAAGLTAASLDGGETPRLLVLAKSDGSSLVAVWDEPPIDDGKGHDITPNGNIARIAFGSMQRFSVHDLLGPAPLTGSNPSGRQFDVGAETTVTLHGYPILIELSAPARP